MTMTQEGTGSTREGIGADLQRTARTAGLLYLCFFVTGIAGTVGVRGQIYAADDANATLANLIEHASLARLGVALELGIVAAQALTAVWLYRLFRSVDTFAAGVLAAFGMVNAVAILASAAMLGTALDVAHDASLTVAGGAAATAQLLYVASDSFWRVGALFFGLWLVPMGWLVLRTRWLPRLLGWVLVAAGLGYTLSAFVEALFSNADVAVQLLRVPSIIGELWIMAYLIVVGARGRATPSAGENRSAS
jgi:Domain of unknown function (DUF4386)